MMCGTCANENALKLIFFRHMEKRRAEEKGRAEFDEDDLEQVRRGNGPRVSILSFKGGFHGRTIGTLSCAISK